MKAIAIIQEMLASATLLLKRLDFIMNLFLNMLFVINDSLLDTFDNFFALKLKVHVLLQDLLSMTVTIHVIVDCRFNQCLVDYSRIDILLHTHLRRVTLVINIR